MNKMITIKLLAIGFIVMGFVHIAATFNAIKQEQNQAHLNYAER